MTATNKVNRTQVNPLATGGSTLTVDFTIDTLVSMTTYGGSIISVTIHNLTPADARKIQRALEEIAEKEDNTDGQTA